MDTAVINIRIDRVTKNRARKVAEELGLSLSGMITGLLKQVIKTKTITLSASDEEPTEYLIKALKESKKDIKNGFVSPIFDSIEDEIAWLNNPKKKYANQIRKKI